MIKRAKIIKLDVQGLGIAQSQDGTTFTVPYSMEGEEVEVTTLPQGPRITSFLKVSSQRIKAPCLYYGICGGCILQHMDAKAYADFKIKKISQALAYYGIEAAPLKPLTVLGPHLRRRVILHALKTTTTLLLGYYQLNSHQLVDIELCLLLRPELEALIKPLKSLLNRILTIREKADILLTSTATGIDLVVKVKGIQTLSLSQTETLKDFALHHQLARISYANDKETFPLVVMRSPGIHFADYFVEASAEGFLQTSTEADTLLASLVKSELTPPITKIADLFCGRGTFSLPLSVLGKVDAYEMDQKALSALNNTCKLNTLNIQTYHRNLFKEPLSLEQLNPYQVVVINPPRQGAIAQCKIIAHSKVPHVIMVSCSPETFARDISILIKGGYSLKTINPVDQFLWSPHVEIVAHLIR